MEGTLLLPGHESFVGAGPMPMRHGLTMGEMGQWFIDHFKIDVEYHVIAMEGWQPEGSRLRLAGQPHLDQPQPQRRQSQHGARLCRDGDARRRDAVGRAAGRPGHWKCWFGAPDIDARAVLAEMQRFAPDWLAGCALRECWFEPTFHKHAKSLCSGLMIHAEGRFYDHHAFRPWRLQALAFKAIRRLYPDYPIWRDFPYEYVFDRLAIDVINGGPALREWVDDAGSEAGDLEALAGADEARWRAEIGRLLLY